MDVRHPALRMRVSRAATRVACIAIVTIGTGVYAQSPSATNAPASTEAVPIARWDALYEGRRYFVLRDAVNAWRGPTTPDIQYFRGLLAYLFNDPDAAISALEPLVNATRSPLRAAHRDNAVNALGKSLRAVYRYRESAEVYRRALRTGGAKLDASTHAHFATSAVLGETLRNALPQRVVWTSEAADDTLPSAGATYVARVTINGAAASVAFTPWTELTTMDSTTAESHAVRILTPQSQRSSPRVGVIESLVLGPATVSNVVVLVTPDSDTMWARSDSPARVIIGTSVMTALRRVTFMRDGSIALSSPGVQPTGDSLTRAIALDGAMPVVAASLADSNADAPVDVLQRRSARDSSGVALNFDAMTATAIVRRPVLPTSVLPTIAYPTEKDAARAPPEPRTLPEDLAFVTLLFALFVIPKALQRYRIPGAITSLVMGIGATALGFFHDDPTLHLLSTFGIVALFLFAGLEIDGRELQKNTRALVLHGALWAVLLAITAWVAASVFGQSPRAAALIALALVTPSTGFILSSLGGFGMLPAEQVAVKTYAVGSELLALAVLFFVLQSTSLQQLALALVAMVGVIVVIPLAFRFFAAVVAPHAPRSEFAFLLMVAVVCAYATRRLGVYYLVGAFLVGVAAQRFRSNNPAMSSEKMVDALESFGSVFIPFYFFRAGTEIVREQLTWGALGIGLALVIVCIPVRIGVIALHRRIAHEESFAAARRIGTAMIPTLVFTLVLVEILHGQYGLSDTMAGALVLYTVLNTTVPAFALRSVPPDFENVLGLDGETSPLAES